MVMVTFASIAWLIVSVSAVLSTALTWLLRVAMSMEALVPVPFVVAMVMVSCRLPAVA
jgi:hypothetical protein